MSASDLFYREVLQPSESEARRERAERGEVPRPRNLKGTPIRLKDGVWYRLVDGKWVEIEEHRS